MRIKSLLQCEWCGAYVDFFTIDYISTYNGELAVCKNCISKFNAIYEEVNDETETEI